MRYSKIIRSRASLRSLSLTMVVVFVSTPSAMAQLVEQANPPEPLPTQTQGSPGYIVPPVRTKPILAPQAEATQYQTRRPPLSTLPDTTSVIPLQPFSAPGSTDPSPSQLQELQQKKTESLIRLHLRAEQIRKMWEQRQQSQSVPVPDKNPEASQALLKTIPFIPLQPSETDSDSNATTEDVATTPGETTQPEQQIPDPPQQHESTESVSPTTTILPQEPETNSIDELSAAMLNATSPNIIDGPIDRLALAASLFATQRYRECLKTIEAIEQDKQSIRDQAWMTYLTASCFRHLQELAQAESHYRQLVNSAQVPWITESARWWLDHLNERRKLEQDLAQLKSTLQAWQGEIDGLATSPGK